MLRGEFAGRAKRAAAVLCAIGLWVGALAPAASGRATGPEGGTIDRTWGTNGTVLIPSPTANFAGVVDAVKDRAGRILVAAQGYDTHADTVFVAARFLPDGTPDGTFGTRGVVTLVVPFGLGPGQIAVDRAGRIVVVMQTIDERVGTAFELLRLRDDGSLDPTFSKDGFSDPFPGTMRALEIDGSNRIYVGGQSFGGAIVWRFTPAGVPDRTYGFGGHVDAYPVLHTRAWDLALDGSSRIVASGQTEDGTAFVARLTANGRRDTTFNGRGYVAIPHLISGLGVAVQADGKVVVTSANADGHRLAIALARVRTDGTLDPAFGDVGVATLVTTAAWTQGNDVDVLPDGDLVVTGSGQLIAADDNGPSNLVALVHADGTFDRSFGCNGLTWSRFVSASGRGGNYARAGILEGSDLIVVGVPLEPGAIALQRIHLGRVQTGGYWLTTADGVVDAFGSAAPCASLAYTSPAHPIVATAARPGGSGYWEVASDGGVFAMGTAQFYGSTGTLRLQAPIVGMTATPSGHGYWLVASDGGVFAFGDARFRGSTGGLRLRAPIVGMSATTTGRGYWLVASDGGVFAFGDARFHGSTGALALRRPVVGMAATTSGAGYWLVASDGGVFAFGNAAFHGSTGALALRSPIVGLAATTTGHGYWLAAADGGVFAFGDAPFRGSDGRTPSSAPFVGITTAR